MFLAGLLGRSDDRCLDKDGGLDCGMSRSLVQIIGMEVDPSTNRGTGQDVTR